MQLLVCNTLSDASACMDEYKINKRERNVSELVQCLYASSPNCTINLDWCTQLLGQTTGNCVFRHVIYIE